MPQKKLSQLEAVELVTVRSGQPNRFLAPRFDHLERRGLIRYDADGTGWRLTSEGAEALRVWEHRMSGGRVRRR